MSSGVWARRARAAPAASSMSREVEDRIAAVARGQHGVITRRQLGEAGLSGSMVDRRVRAGRLEPLHRGVYLVGPLAPPGAREIAAVLASGPGAVLSHLTAAPLWGLREASDAGEPVDVTIPGANRGRRPGIRMHRVVRLDIDEHTVLDGIPITIPGRTLVDVAGVVGVRELERAVARAEREGLVTREALSALLLRYPRRPGTPALRMIADAQAGPALTRSAAEAEFLALVRQAGLPVPEANVAVGPYEIDFLWRAQGIAVEVDGFHHHSSRPRFEGDRRKDAWLLAGGIKVLRLSWRQIVDGAMATAVHVAQALAHAGAGRA